VIRDLSKALFGRAFEKDIQQWKSVKKSSINKAAYKLLQENTKAMQAIDPDIEKFIKR
jgi:hypothetical protein